ncbi:hypothetical protein Bca4012_063196 [Brassica carinata]|uniref:Uncharacterized protein n=1 Tax=Brassica carinata TaxID=52824 RepID=A0A8X7SBC3_BRACI|nr:hypothetical protein Bca52824_032934 [Brassica carinata]
MEKNCSKCFRLDHELRDCLEAKHQKKALIAAKKESEINKEAPESPKVERGSVHNHISGNSRQPPRRENSSRPVPSRNHSVRHSDHRDSLYNRNRHAKSPYRQEWQPLKNHHRESHLRKSHSRLQYDKPYSHRCNAYFRGLSHFDRS